ncbi:unnamed protein product [Mytilus edulis]|uniref:Cep192-like domain-containing protein n=1 Tax=Mytilus edulis TaxID=6550 RepID=A0A8S3US12_MYTED|nr:unnamed protein product [Mytilus edulis]
MSQYPPTEMYARIEVEVDTPSHLPLISSIDLKSVVGVAKLHLSRQLEDAKFVEGVEGVSQLKLQPRLAEVQRKVQELCAWKRESVSQTMPSPFIGPLFTRSVLTDHEDKSDWVIKPEQLILRAPTKASCVSCKVKIKDMDEMPSHVDQHSEMQVTEIEDRIPVIEDSMSRIMQQQMTELSHKRDHTSSEDFHYNLRENKPKIVLHDVIDIESTDHVNFSQSLESHTKGIQPLVLPQHAWGTYSQKTKKSFVNKLFSCFTAVTETMFPNESDEILQEILKASEVIDKETDVNSDAELCQAMVKSYMVTDTWQVRRPILSVISKKHASVQGCALPPAQGNKSRQRMDPAKLDNFLDFITSSHIIKDLPFGERKLKLADGRSVDTPNVIRCMAPATLINMYNLYCSENEVTPLGHTEIFRGTETTGDLSVEVFKRHMDVLLECKRYLKTDYKVHISSQSTVPDHCKVFALSDNKDQSFKSKCLHEHDSVCQNCEQVTEFLSSVTHLVEEETIEDQDIYRYKVNQAVTSINSWKQHIVRSRNQDGAKSKLLENMLTSEVFIVFDWAMKYLPRRYREDQSNWFAKRGINWHISIVFHKTENDLESLGFVHIFQNQISQDSRTTSAVILDTIRSVKEKYPQMDGLHLWSDNAGCYKSTETISALFHSGEITSYNFCEAQDGKGACDRTAATLKSGIRRYLNQGHDVVTASQMKKAIETTAKNVKYVVKVVDFKDLVPVSVAVKMNIPSLSTYNNFQFEKDFIRFDTINKKVERSEDVFVCSNDGCMASFSTYEECQDHAIIDNCELQPEKKIKVEAVNLYVEKLNKSHFNLNNIEIASTTSQSVSPNVLQMGWSLKEGRKNVRFNDKQKQYLIDKFNNGIV